MSTTRIIRRIAPLQLGKMMGIAYAAFGLLFIPFFLLISAFATRLPPQQRVGMLAFGAGFAIFVPFIYGAMGFLFGVIGAWIYNMTAKFIGGVEVDVE